jgi:hypothetical protein
VYRFAGLLRGPKWLARRILGQEGEDVDDVVGAWLRRIGEVGYDVEDLAFRRLQHVMQACYGGDKKGDQEAAEIGQAIARMAAVWQWEREDVDGLAGLRAMLDHDSGAWDCFLLLQHQGTKRLMVDWCLKGAEETSWMSKPNAVEMARRELVDLVWHDDREVVRHRALELLSAGSLGGQRDGFQEIVSGLHQHAANNGEAQIGALLALLCHENEAVLSFAADSLRSLACAGASGKREAVVEGLAELLYKALVKAHLPQPLAGASEEESPWREEEEEEEAAWITEEGARFLDQINPIVRGLMRTAEGEALLLEAFVRTLEMPSLQSQLADRYGESAEEDGKRASLVRVLQGVFFHSLCKGVGRDVVLKLCKDESSEIRRAAVQVLPHMATTMAGEERNTVLELWLNMLGDSDPSVREEAMIVSPEEMTFACVSNAGVVAALMKRLKETADEEVFKWTTGLILEGLVLPGEAVVGVLLDRIQTGATNGLLTRRQAISTLRNLERGFTVGKQQVRVVTAFKRILQSDEDPGVRYEAALALASVGEGLGRSEKEQVLKVLLEAIQRGEGDHRRPPSDDIVSWLASFWLASLVRAAEGDTKDGVVSSLVMLLRKPYDGPRLRLEGPLQTEVLRGDLGAVQSLCCIDDVGPEAEEALCKWVEEHGFEGVRELLSSTWEAPTGRKVAAMVVDRELRRAKVERSQLQGGVEDLLPLLRHPSIFTQLAAFHVLCGLCGLDAAATQKLMEGLMFGPDDEQEVWLWGYVAIVDAFASSVRHDVATVAGSQEGIVKALVGALKQPGKDLHLMVGVLGAMGGGAGVVDLLLDIALNGCSGLEDNCEVSAVRTLLRLGKEELLKKNLLPLENGEHARLLRVIYLDVSDKVWVATTVMQIPEGILQEYWNQDRVGRYGRMLQGWEAQYEAVSEVVKQDQNARAAVLNMLVAPGPQPSHGAVLTDVGEALRARFLQGHEYAFKLVYALGLGPSLIRIPGSSSA